MTGAASASRCKHAYGDGFDLSAQDLRRAAKVESYRGFVFASINGEVPPLVEHLAHARRYLDEWLDRGDGLPVVVRAGDMQFNTHANWKTVYDNAGDGYHPPFSHDSMLRVFARRYGDVDMQYYSANFDEAPLLSRDLGNGHTLLDQRPAMHAQSAWERQHVMPGREAIRAQLDAKYGPERALAMLDASTGSGLNLNIFPNLLIIGNQIQMVEPVAVDRTVVHWFSTTLDGAPGRGERRSHADAGGLSLFRRGRRYRPVRSLPGGHGDRARDGMDRHPPAYGHRRRPHRGRTASGPSRSPPTSTCAATTRPGGAS